MLNLFYSKSKPDIKVVALKWMSSDSYAYNDISFLAGKYLSSLIKNDNNGEPYISIYDCARKGIIDLRQGNYLVWINNQVTICTNEYFHNLFCWCGNSAIAKVFVLDYRTMEGT